MMGRELREMCGYFVSLYFALHPEISVLKVCEMC